MTILLDSSILIEYIKGSKTELLDAIIITDVDIYINHIVFSEFIFHFLSARSGKSPLTLKNSSLVANILNDYKPMEFIANFNTITMDANTLIGSYELMSRFNLLPNDSLILQCCVDNEIPYLASFDVADFTTPCTELGITLIDSVDKFIHFYK